MEDLGTGEYVSHFSAVHAGAYQVTVLHGDTNIAGSPFAAVVAPADIDPAASYAMGEGMQKARCGQKGAHRDAAPLLLSQTGPWSGGSHLCRRPQW